MERGEERGREEREGGEGKKGEKREGEGNNSCQVTAPEKRSNALLFNAFDMEHVLETR